jgi:cardiolipin synthase
MDTYQQHFEDATGTKFRPGNALKLFQNGNEIFPAMLDGIRAAQTSIEFATYVYWRSHVASEFADALCERARAGIEVRLLVDAIGGAIMSTRTVGQLERAGVRVAWFRPLRFGHLRGFNNRTHRKILVIDGRIGFTGGVGIADQWDGNADNADHWRETHCRVTGPASIDLHEGFAANWFEATKERLTFPEVPVAAGSIAVQTTSSMVGSRPTAMEQLFMAAITGAKERLWITTAYFVPSRELVVALTAASRRNVDVRIITNGHRTNHKFTRWAGQANYEVLIEAGVKIYEYQRTVLHAKLITLDRVWATIGSANFDNRSLILNDELNISVLDPTLAERLDMQFWRDIKNSKHIGIALWHRRSWTHHLAIAGSRVFSDQL